MHKHRLQYLNALNSFEAVLTSFHPFNVILPWEEATIVHLNDYEDRKQSAVSETHSILREQAQWLLLKN